MELFGLVSRGLLGVILLLNKYNGREPYVYYSRVLAALGMVNV